MVNFSVARDFDRDRAVRFMVKSFHDLRKRTFAEASFYLILVGKMVANVNVVVAVFIVEILLDFAFAFFGRIEVDFDFGSLSDSAPEINFVEAFELFKLEFEQLVFVELNESFSDPAGGLQLVDWLGDGSRVLCFNHLRFAAGFFQDDFRVMKGRLRF